MPGLGCGRYFGPYSYAWVGLWSRIEFGKKAGEVTAAGARDHLDSISG